MTTWPAPHVEDPINATVVLPGSKSTTNRALLLSALADGPSTVTGALRSRDTDLMVAALRSMGTDIREGQDALTVTPGPLHGGQVACGLAGTIMRFLPAVAALADGEVRFDGDEQAKARPLRPLLDALRALGADISGDSLPFTVRGHGGLRGGSVSLDASASSQFVSGLLLSGARFTEGLRLHHTGSALPSLPHIAMTVEMLAHAGVTVEAPSDIRAPQIWTVPPGPIHAAEWDMQPDLSNATPFLAAAALTGGRVRIPQWPRPTSQPGDVIREILVRMGAEARFSDDALVVTGPDRLHGIDIDLHHVGELTPTVTALAAFAESPSRLRGIAHLRGHETDRLAALEREFGNLGGNVRQIEDGLEITPTPLHGGLWHSHRDHRIATAGAIVGLAVPGIEIDDVATTAKTLPEFVELWETMAASHTHERGTAVDARGSGAGF